MKLKLAVLLIFTCLLVFSSAVFANGRAKWLVDSHKKEQISGACVFKAVKVPATVNRRWFDYDNQGEVPRGSFSKSLGVFSQYSFVWLGAVAKKINLPSGLLHIYSFRFIRLLLFPHHAFD